MNKKNYWLFLTLLLVAPSFLSAQTELNFNGFEDKLDAYISALSSVGEFSGTVLVSYHGDTKFHKGYGLASKRFNIQNDITTKFRIASMTKSFTAICVLQLVEQQKLDLEESISSYIEFPFGHSIKLKHLLSHSSGLKRDMFFADENKRYSLDELVSMVKVDSLLFQPGTATAYSNCDYILLQAILEKVSGIDFESYVSKYVLFPLGLTNTGVEHPLSPPTGLADGFGPGVDRNGNYEVHETQLISFGYSDGVTALYSTTGDMLKFCSQLGKSPILKPETWKLAFTPVVKESPFVNWGLGFTIIGNADAPVINHNGKTTGFKGGYYHDLKDDFTVIMLGNNSEAARSSIVNTIQAILEGKEYYTPKVYSAFPIKSEDLKAYVGNYKAGEFEFSISEFNGRLFVKSHGDAPSSLSAFSSDSFSSDYFDLKLIFNRHKGLVTQCEWIFQNQPVKAEKI